jgi:hypothetical protein
MDKVYTFGNGSSLIGILTEPSSGLQTNGSPAVLLWNAGLLHRVGPYRLYVDTARKLASLGFLVFRFDVSGKGDSEPSKDNRSHVKRAISDIQEAMNFVSSKKGIDEFVLMGLCSGADEAHPTAVLDSRVSGVVFLDGYGYRTWGFYLRRYGSRILRPEAWENFLKRQCSRVLIGRRGNDDGGSKERIFEREFPSRKIVSADLKQLVGRGVNLLYIYSGGVESEYYNYHGQFRAMFRSIDFQGKLRLEYFKEAAHTYNRMADRNRLLKCICEWLLDLYKA